MATKTKTTKPADQATPEQPTTQPTPEEVEAAARAEQVAALQAKRAKVLAQLAELDDQLAVLLPHMLVTSVVTSPVALCREVFVAMYGSRRRDVVAALVNKGVAPNTAKTQYQVLKGKAERGELPELLAATPQL